MNPSDDGPGDRGERVSADREVTLLGEVLSLPPRLASRTIAQIQASQQLMGLLRCASTSSRTADRESTDGDGASLTEPVDVLAVLGEDSAVDSAATDGDDDAGSPPLRTGDRAATPTEDTDQPPGGGPMVPAPDDLAIPGYDSLAASQVVPRLTTLSIAELDAIGAYENANRGRRTILNRVRQLRSSNGED